jgi:hypothetical protein
MPTELRPCVLCDPLTTPTAPVIAATRTDIKYRIWELAGHRVRGEKLSDRLNRDNGLEAITPR